MLVLCVAYEGKRSWLKDVEDTFDKLANVSHRYSDMKGKILCDWVQLIRIHPGLFYRGIKQTFENWDSGINSVGFW